MKKRLKFWVIFLTAVVLIAVSIHTLTQRKTVRKPTPKSASYDAHKTPAKDLTKFPHLQYYESGELERLIKDTSTAESLMYGSTRLFLKGIMTPEKMAERTEKVAKQIGLEKAVIVIDFTMARYGGGKNVRPIAPITKETNQEKTQDMAEILRKQRESHRKKQKVTAEETNAIFLQSNSYFRQQFDKIVQPKRDAIINLLKANMHNPDRFEFISMDIVKVDKELAVYRIKFRGENAFGALRIAEQKFSVNPEGTIKWLD